MSDSLIAALDLVMPGDLVIYHGSITDHHGLYLAQPCACIHCVRGDRKGKADPRYLLTNVADATCHLRHVRRRSIDLAAN